MPIENLINFGLGQADQYNVTFASSVKDGDKDKDVTVNGAQSIEVVKSYIDNKTRAMQLRLFTIMDKYFFKRKIR